MSAYTLAEIAEKIGGEPHGDLQLKITGTAEIDKAGDGDLTFLANPKYRSHLQTTGAAAVIIDEKAGIVPSIPYIKTADAYYGFLRAFLLFNAPKQLLEPGIHPSAVIHKSVQIGADVAVGANVYIGPGVQIGDRCQIFPNCVILDDCHLGEDCLLYPSVSIRENCRLGKRIIAHNGVVIGSDGFGFVPFQGVFHKIPQVGRVVIEDDVEIGANVTIDRATMGETIIRAGVKLDNLVHIAHNCEIGPNTVVAAQSGISGSTRIGENVMMGGQVGIVGHLKIGDRVQVAAQSGVTKNLADEETVFGSPALPMGKASRIQAIIRNLPELIKRIRQLEKTVAQITRDQE